MTPDEPAKTPDIPPHVWAAAEPLIQKDALRIVRGYIGANGRLLQDVEDVAQDVCLAFWKSLSTFEQRTPDLAADLRGLLSTVAMHHVQNAGKRARRAAERLEAAILERAQQRGISPQRLVSYEQGVEFLLDRMQELDSTRRQIVDHLFGRDATIVDTATALDVPEYTIRRERERTLDQLYELMGTSGKYTLSPVGDSR